MGTSPLFLLWCAYEGLDGEVGVVGFEVFFYGLCVVLKEGLCEEGFEGGDLFYVGDLFAACLEFVDDLFDGDAHGFADGDLHGDLLDGAVVAGQGCWICLEEAAALFVGVDEAGDKVALESCVVGEDDVFAEGCDPEVDELLDSFGLYFGLEEIVGLGGDLVKGDLYDFIGQSNKVFVVADKVCLAGELDEDALVAGGVDASEDEILWGFVLAKLGYFFLCLDVEEVDGFVEVALGFFPCVAAGGDAGFGALS